MKNMSEMEVINFESTPSLVNRYMMELRDVTVQNDPMRFRTNLDRIGQIMAYEISKRLDYKETQVQTPLGKSVCREPADKVVLATILRAGIPFHHGFLSYFDHAENAFVSAYRRYRKRATRSMCSSSTSPRPLSRERLLFWWTYARHGQLDGTGLQGASSKGTPARIHVASVVASIPEWNT